MKCKSNGSKTVREIAIYLIFGVLTTAVAMLTYFGVLWAGETILAIEPTENDFYYVRLAAEILQWIIAVLFAFFTNKKWVFTDADRDVSTLKQLGIFASGRLVTLGLDTLITFGSVWLLQKVGYAEFSLNILITLSVSADFIAKMAASVVVVISNYFISKLFVFKKKTDIDN